MIFLLDRHACNSVTCKKRLRNSGGSSKVEGCGNRDSYMSWRTARATTLSSDRFGSRLSFRQINFLWIEQKYCIYVSYKCTAFTKFCISLVTIEFNWLEASSFTLTSLCCRQLLLSCFMTVQFSVLHTVWYEYSHPLTYIILTYVILHLCHLPPESIY